MSSNQKNEALDHNRAKMILQNLVDEGRAGLFIWDIQENSFEIMENLTGREFINLKTLEEFILQYVIEKDIAIAMTDVQRFMSGEQPNYVSTFRIWDSDGNIRWIYAKGTMHSDHLMTGLLYDMTERNLYLGHDVQTNLMTGEIFLNKLKHITQRANIHGEMGALLYIEIDNFVSITNKYGFAFGNDILTKFTHILIEYVSDQPGSLDELARFPFDKFMMLKYDVKNRKEVEKISQEITQIFNQPLMIDEQEVYLKVNMGVTLFPKMSSDFQELIRFSDFALSHARKDANNKPVFFDKKLMPQYKRRMDIETELPKAIYNNEFHLVYQPQLDIQEDKITGFEALIRWENEELGFVSPAEFIPIAEEKGYIVEIDRWVREETIKTAREWMDKGITFERVSMNVSSIEFLQKNFKETLLETCAKYQFPTEKIELEITEGTMMEAGLGNNILQELLDEGFKLAIDDFGTGYSNLTSLFDFDIHTLKIDKSLVDDIHNPKQKYIFDFLLSGKNQIYEHIIAEGVEDKETMDSLAELGIDCIQGYYFSKPISKDDMEQFYKEFNRE